MQVLVEEHGTHVVAMIVGRPGCAAGPDRQTAIHRLQQLGECGPSPFATVRKRLSERTGQGVSQSRR